MAITVVQAGVVEYSAVETSVTFTLPLDSGPGSSLSPGEVLLFNVTTNAIGTPVITPPIDALTIVAMNSHPGVYSASAGVYVWTIPDPKPNVVTFTWSTARRGSLAWVAVRGADIINPVNAFGVIPWTTSDDGPATKTVPSVTTTIANCLVVGGIIQGSGSAVITPPAGWTTQTNALQRDGHISTRDALQTTPGPTGSASFFVDSVQSHYRWTIAIAPAELPPTSRWHSKGGGNYILWHKTSEGLAQLS